MNENHHDMGIYINMKDLISHTEKILVIIDSQLAAENYCSRYRNRDSSDCNYVVIALYPNIKAYLERKGHTCNDTQQYLSKDGRDRASYKSSEITHWIRNNFDFTDNLRVTHGYIENLVWYSRWSYNHIIQLIEIVTTAIDIHKPTRLITFDYQKIRNTSDPYPILTDMYIKNVCEHYCSQNHIDTVLEQIRPRINFRSLSKIVGRKLRELATTNIMAAQIHSRRISQFAKVHPVLFTSDQYRLNTVASIITSGNISVCKLQDWPRTPTLSNPLKKKPKDLFLSDIQIHAIEALSKDDEQSRYRLKYSLDNLLTNMNLPDSVFNYRGFDLTDSIINKIKIGIVPVMFQLHKRVSTFRNILNTIQPSIVFSNGCRSDDIIMGELCENMGVPAMIITHGSHVPESNPESGIEWQEHARRLINAPFQYTALQSPLAEKFRNEFSYSNKSISTGPLTWATPTNKTRSDKLKLDMLRNNSTDKVIVHAGTAKGSDGFRFHIFETPDEYVQSIMDVSEAVNNIPNARLIVIFRPIPEISTDTLVYNLAEHNKTLVSINNPLIDILGFTDLLISFSSTVIEEALQNYTPVILYGGQGRYKHIDCPEFSDNENLQIDCPMYHVSNKKYLESAIKSFLNGGMPVKNKPQMFSPYVFNREDIIPVNQILSETLLSTISTENNLKSL